MKTDDVKIIDSKTIFEDKREVLIDHNGNIYILRITKENKLILTK